ncbi:MAG: hypothetical protein B1H04_02715 [Planctomycetales bacterium 4484_123]|nr:MAG: hypothetical protein B1H04_02715 [Planctomycetales bacterium 4484_123]
MRAPAGCKVMVGLGLKLKFERNIAWDPYELPTGNGGSQLRQFRRNRKHLLATGPAGELYVLGLPTRGGFIGRVFDRQGRYLRTFWPPPAKDVGKLAKLGYRFTTTTWGDRVPMCCRYGPAVYQGDPRKLAPTEIGKTMFAVAGVSEYRLGPRPALDPRQPAPLGGGHRCQRQPGGPRRPIRQRGR